MVGIQTGKIVIHNCAVMARCLLRGSLLLVFGYLGYGNWGGAEHWD
jgi:hypothetical protein